MSQPLFQQPRRVCCGCFIIVQRQHRYLPLVNSNVHATILSSTSRTTLTQTFTNPSSQGSLSQVRYVFPLYDGVSVVGFTCTVGSRVIKGVVKERREAKQVFEKAVQRGETAGLLEQSLAASDVFTTTLGNVPAGETIKVEITYLGELHHDAEIDGVRFTIPTRVAPRYGDEDLIAEGARYSVNGAISITVDADMTGCSAIRSIQSPSHPISVDIGTTSTAADASPVPHRASATLSLSHAGLDKDFIVQVVASGLGDPAAILETHPTIPNRRALMTTLVPRFNLPSESAEIVFVCDRSGSMGQGQKIPNLIAALQLFLKSLPIGVKFNICSFGSRHSFLWSQSQLYGQDTLEQAVAHVSTFDCHYGGTEMLAPMQETFKRRGDGNLEVFLMTDGEIWDQGALFELINTHVTSSKGAIRVFSLGVGEDVSHALIEGVARAGNGFSQSVGTNERMEKKVVRMLKGALTPHVTDYSLEIKYEKEDAIDVEHQGDDDDGFCMVEKVMEGLTIDVEVTEKKPEAQPTSLFNPALKAEDMDKIESPTLNLPAIAPPRYLQTPCNIPSLFPFNRTTVYVLLSESAPHQRPKSVVLRGTSAHGPLTLEIPITPIGEPGTTIQQLAARKAIGELEEGRGWIHHAKDSNEKLLKDEHSFIFTSMVQREAVRLGVEYQVGGKWCSFVAVRENDEDGNTGLLDGSGNFENIEAGEVEPLQSSSWLGGPGRGGLMSLSKPLMRSGFGGGGPMPPPPPAPASALFGSFASESVQDSAHDKNAGAQSFGRPGGGGALFQRTGGAGRQKQRSSPTGLFGQAPSGTSPPKQLLAGSGSLFQRSRKVDASPAQEPLAGTVSHIATLQSFAGSWTWSPELERAIGITEREAWNISQPAKFDNQSNILATLCTVVYLQEKLAQDKDAWELLVDKAESWLHDQATAAGAVDVLHSIREQVKKRMAQPV